MDHTKDYIQKRAPKIYSHELVTVIFEIPYCRIQNLTQKNIVERQAASRYLKTLTQIGVLREISEGRDKIFIHPKLMSLLSDETNKFKLYPETPMEPGTEGM